MIRPAAVAGTFYPAEPERLQAVVAALLAQASYKESGGKAFVVPHAGYLYSGAVAANVYAALARNLAVRRLVLLGPAHYAAVNGLALSSASHFTTPLGRVALDQTAMAALRDLPQIKVADEAHAPEHCLEVQLPFLQATLSEFTIIPILVGRASVAEIVEVLERLWGGGETVLLISSDLSHFHCHEDAQRIDQATEQQILGLSNEPLVTQQACGARAINGLLTCARRRGLRVTKIQRCTSADTAGDEQRVVGYGAYAFFE